MWKSSGLWVVVGVIVGGAAVWVAGGMGPATPVLAVSTQGHESCVIATGFADEDIEAVMVIDQLTGDLKASVINFNTGKFNSLFEYNVAKDLASPGVKNPRYLMVTGVANLRVNQTRNFAPSRSIIYVAEVTGGKVAAYIFPWNAPANASNVPQRAAFQQIAVWQFRTAAVRPE